MSTIGEKIAELRRMKNMTQEDLAAAIGISAQSVSKWENNVTMPDIMLLPIISQIFDVSIDALFKNESMEPESITFDEVFDTACDSLKNTICRSWFARMNSNSFKDEFKKYTQELESNSQLRSVIIRNKGVVYYRNDIGGLILKKPKDGWESLLNDENAAKSIALLSNRDFVKALYVIIKNRLTNFTISTLCRLCQIEDQDGLEQILSESYFFDVNEVLIDEQNIKFYKLQCAHRLFVVFAILLYAKELTEYQDSCYYYACDADFLNG